MSSVTVVSNSLLLGPAIAKERIEDCVMLAEHKSNAVLSRLRKQIEVIGMEIKNLNEHAETGRFVLKTNSINQHL
jgi:hypothetical protein